MLDMSGHIDETFNSQVPGGVRLLRGLTADYNGPGGTYQDVYTDAVTLPLINVQAADKKTVEFMAGIGGTTNPRDIRRVYLNDGTYLYPADTKDDGTQKPFDVLEFSDGVEVRQWQVRHADNREWRNYCAAIVERINNS